jgi:xanthine dehydrogenase YagT iron-sulfur-binding subunit
MSHEKFRQDSPLSLTGSSPSPSNANTPDASRRRFLQSGVAVTAVSVAFPATHAHAQSSPDTVNAPAALERMRSPAGDVTSLSPAGSTTQPVTLTINGRTFDLHLEPRVTLLDALREYAGLTGTKKGCDRGQCGACTVIANGRRINSCLSLAIMHVGETITTVEGLATNNVPSPLQHAFIEHDAFQCGFCTPGQLCSATAMIDEFHAGDASAASSDVRQKASQLTDAEIRERMSGNICRCGAYPNIVTAIATVAIRQA